MSSDGQRDWKYLFSLHQAGLAAFFRRRMRNSADASEMTQEVYLRFLRADRNELIRNPEAYLYTVALNLVRERLVLQRRWGQTVVAADAESEPALADFRTPEAQVDAAARIAEVLELVETLPPKLKAVLVLQYRDGYTYEQIAKRLGVTPHAIKKYVSQALALCRKRLLRREGIAR